MGWLFGPKPLQTRLTLNPKVFSSNHEILNVGIKGVHLLRSRYINQRVWGAVLQVQGLVIRVWGCSSRLRIFVETTVASSHVAAL